jgi:hypothetical protein
MLLWPVGFLEVVFEAGKGVADAADVAVVACINI